MNRTAIWILGLAVSTCAASAHGQSWKDALKKAKQKIESQTNKNTSPTPTSTANPSGTSLPGGQPAPGVAPTTATPGASDVTTAPNSGEAGSGWFTFCWTRSGIPADSRTFFSDYIPTPYTNGGQFRSKRVEMYEQPFAAYVARTYKLPQNNMKTSCQDPSRSTQELATNIRITPGAVRTGWKGAADAGAPTIASGAQAQSRGGVGATPPAPKTRSKYQPAEDLQQFETHGPKGYTYCYTRSGTTTYLSGVFEANGPDAGMTTEKFRALFSPHYATPFQYFVDIKYNVPNQSSHGCVDPMPTEQAASEYKESHYHSTSSYPVVETDWLGSMTTAVATQGLHPETSSTLYLQRAIEQEASQLAPMCSHNVMLSANLDCECFARHVSETRNRSQNTLASEGAGLQPTLSQLYPESNLEGCASSARIEQSVSKRIDSMSISPSQKAAFKSCVPQKVAAAVLSEPSALLQSSIYNSLISQSMQSCPAPR